MMLITLYPDNVDDYDYMMNKLRDYYVIHDEEVFDDHGKLCIKSLITRRLMIQRNGEHN